MKKLLILALTAISFSSTAQPIERYFESIRDNAVELTAFFSLMPKGGDLHNHYSGSVYAETYISYVVGEDYVINTNTLEVRTKAPLGDNAWVHFSKLNATGQLPA